MIDRPPSLEFIPHGYCLSWQPGLIAALVIGNVLIALAYFTIPLVILKFIHQRKDIDFRSLHWLFAAFIVTCGVTHLLHVVELWYPAYYLEAVMDMLTAIISVVAAIMLWKLLPVVVSLPSVNQLRGANEELRKTEAQLREKELQLRNLGNSLPDSFIFIYQYGEGENKPRFLYVSSGVERLSGVKPELVMQDAWSLLGKISPEQQEAFAAAQDVSRRDSSDFAMELHMLGANGAWRWLQVKSHPRTTGDGRLVWDGIAMDITDRHLYESEINRLAQAIEQNPSGIVITDTQGKLEYMNAACTLITGYQFAEALKMQRTPREMISTEMTEAEFGEVKNQVLTGRTWIGVMRNRHKNGRMFWERVSLSPIYDNTGIVVSFLYLSQDVSVQKNAEADLKLRSDELQRANADLTRFADVSAHHLMEPTRRLTSYTQQLRAQISTLPGVEQNQELNTSLEYIEHDAARLRVLVRDIQLYLAASMPRGEVVMEDCNALMDTLRQRFELQLAAQHTTLEFGMLPSAVLDRPRLMDLFGVLLDNALHYGQPVDPNMPACICVSGEREGNLSRFRVCDNGGGIPEEYLERVFEIFERLSMANRDAGTGIGLAIARRIVESRHGRIWIENLPESGAMAVFELPDGD